MPGKMISSLYAFDKSWKKKGEARALRVFGIQNVNKFSKQDNGGTTVTSLVNSCRKVANSFNHSEGLFRHFYSC